MNFFFGNVYFDLFHLCRIRPALRPFDQAAHLERISLCNGLDGSICAVPHPASYLELLCTKPHRLAEEDALDAAGDAKAAGDFQGP